MSIVKSITTGGLLLGGAIMLWPRDLIGAASRRLEDARRGAQRYVSDGVQWAGDKVRTALSIETHALTEHALRSGDDLKITKAIVSLVDTARIWIAGLLHVAKRHTEIKWPPLVTLGLLLAPLVVVLVLAITVVALVNFVLVFASLLTLAVLAALTAILLLIALTIVPYLGLGRFLQVPLEGVDDRLTGDDRSGRRGRLNKQASSSSSMTLHGDRDIDSRLHSTTVTPPETPRSGTSTAVPGRSPSQPHAHAHGQQSLATTPTAGSSGRQLQGSNSAGRNRRRSEARKTDTTPVH